MIDSTNVIPAQKVKYELGSKNLRGYGDGEDSEPFREARKFPPRPVNKDKLLRFLCRTSWYAGV